MTNTLTYMNELLPCHQNLTWLAQNDPLNHLPRGIAMNKFTPNNLNIMTASLAMSVLSLLVTWGVELWVKELFRLG